MLVAVVTCALAACSWQRDDHEPPARRPEVVLWSQHALRPFSPVSAVDGVGVALASGHGLPYILGLDPASGRLLWRRETTPSSTPRGIAMTVAAAGNYVALLAPVRDGTYAARMQIVKARTGEAVALSPRKFFVRPPSVCDDDPRAFCSEVMKGEEDVVSVRMRPERSRLVVDRRVGESVQSVGDGGLSVNWGPPEQLSVQKKGRRLWLASAVALMGPRSDLAYGWDFDLDAKEDRYVGTVGRPAIGRGVKRAELADTSTAAFRASDGHPLWRDEGSSLRCHGILDEVRIDDARTSHLRCRATGTLTWRKGAEAPKIDRLDVTLEQFDPATGRTTWQVPLGPARGLIRHDADDARLVVDDRRRIFVAGSQRTTVDLVTGQAVATDPATRAWCVSQTRLRDPLGAKDEDGEVEEVYGGEVSRPCDARGRPIADIPTTWPSALVTHFEGGVVLVASPHGFVGYGPTPPQDEPTRRSSASTTTDAASMP